MMKELSRFPIKSGLKNIDFDKVTSMLSGVYWSEGIGKAEVIRGARNSALVVGAFSQDGQQIGYARVISDKTRFACILDVVVDEHHRKKGAGQSMIRFILDHPSLRDVYQWLLITRDAHGVYQKAGFTPLTRPEGWMEIRSPRPSR